ncbi:RNA methyltransferase, TrmH family, group 3 [gamma proteobacterium HTCC5015]|nr:RNA methyltransferase, TrmH family, group 3 [gamma proteobacterium HTCC5015]
MARRGKQRSSGSKRGTKSPQFLFGLHAVEAFIQRRPEEVFQLYWQKGADQRLGKLQALATQLGLPTQYVERQQLDDWVDGARHQGVIAQVRSSELWREADLEGILDGVENVPLVLVLDGVTDPHNLGACLRSANGAGVDVVIAPKDKSAGLTAVSRKVACGAAEETPFIQVTNLARTLKGLAERGLWIVGLADGEDRSLYEGRLDGPMALVMGAEGDGLRRLTRESCDEIVAIPMGGSVSSLNVSVAAGVCLYEVVRQRRAPSS